MKKSPLLTAVQKAQILGDKMPLAIADFQQHPALHPRPTPIRPRPKQKRPVTILFGIICDEGIVMASDSQGTVDNFSLPADKISVVKFNSDETLAAKAGNCLLANRVVEIIQEKALHAELNESRQLADLAEAAIRQIRDQLVDDGQKQWLAENPFQLLLAQCGPYEPRLFVADSIGITNRVDTFYATAGCGAVLAECLLNEFLSKPKTLGEAIAVAVYIIAKVKRYDAFCGGPTVVKVAPRIPNIFQKQTGLFPPGLCQVIHWPQEYIDELERRLAVSEQSEKLKRTALLSDMMKKAGEDWLAPYLKDSPAKPDPDGQQEPITNA